MPIILAIPFIAFVGAFILVGLSQTHSAQHGNPSANSWLYQALTAPLQLLSQAASKALRATVSRFASAQLPHLTQYFTGLALLVGQVFGVNANQAEATASAVERVYDSIDGKVAEKVTPVAKTAKTAAKTASHASTAAKAAHTDLTHYKQATTPKVRHATKAVDVALPQSIAHVNKRVTTLDRDIGALRDRTKSLEDGAVKTFEWIRSHPLSGTTLIAAGAITAALSRIGFGFLRCRNWQNLGKSLTCGMGKWLLDALEAIAAFALTYLSILKPEVLAEEAVAAVNTIEGVLTEILKN